MTLSDSQRRTLLRILFLTVCVLPCLATFVWGWVIRTDAYRNVWQQSLSAHLGMRVIVAKVRTPRPGVVLLENVRGYDPETDAEAFNCRALEIEDFADGRHLRASQPEIHALHGGRLFASLERRLRRETPDAETAVTFEAAELTWRVGGESQTLVDVDALAGPAESAQQLLINFALPGTPSEHPAAVKISRHTSAQPETTVELDTGAAVVPCSLLAPLTDAATVLGRQARFAGRVKLRHTADGWNGVVAGDVTDADLDSLVSERFPHVLSGSAELQIHRVEIAGGRLERADVSVEAGPGQVSWSLVDALEKHLGMANVPTVQPSSGKITPFTRLTFDASVVGGRLTIKARSAERHGVVMQSDGALQLHEAAGPQPTANLLRALAPAADVQVPAVAAAAALVPWLSVVESGAQQRGEVPAGTLPAAVRLRVREASVPDETQLR